MVRKIIDSERVVHDNGIPLKTQLREILRKQIFEKTIGGENGKLPTESELVIKYGVSRVTVRGALQMLEDEGIITREQGRGTFLKSNHPENWIGKLMGFSELIQEAGMNQTSKILFEGQPTKVNKYISKQLNVDRVWQLDRLRISNDIPIAIENAYFPLEFKQYFETQNNESLAIYMHLENQAGLRLKNAIQKISAIEATKWQAKNLEVAEKSALIYIERTTFSEDDRPIEYLKAFYRPDHFHYEIELSRR